MGHSETLDVLLGRICGEVAATADCVSSIQVGAAQGQTGVSSLSEADLVDLQKLDLVEQTLRSLVTVLEAIAATKIGATPTDLSALLGTLPLAGLSDRLRGTPEPVEPLHGHVELF